jgi:hypothetical protein
MRSWVLALLTLAACGDVNKAPPDAPPLDAYQPDSAFSCGAGEMVCGGVCADVMTSSEHCGGCDTQCSPIELCTAGACAQPTTCNQVRKLNPGVPNGTYPVGAPGKFYCDFTNNMTYVTFGLGRHDMTYTDFVLMASTDFNDPAIRAAFIGLYNAQGGIVNIDIGFNGDNCCFRPADAVGAAGDLLLGGAGHFVYPAHTASAAFQCGGPYTDPVYRMYINSSLEYSPVPLPANYFDTHVASVGTDCSGTMYPGVFMKRHPGLD